MAKRGGSELTHDNWDQEEEREDAGTFKKATDGDMKGRVIKRARRRNAGGEEGGEKKNVFSGFGGFAAKPDASQAFSFLSKPAEPEKPAGGGFVFGSATGAAAPKPAQTVGFSFGSPSSGPAKPSFGAFGTESKSDAPTPVFGSFSSDKSSSSPATTPLFGSKSDAAPAATFGSFAFGGKKDSTPEPAAKVEDPPAPKSDFSAFKQPPGWSCSACMVKNPLDMDSCLSCETPKPGSKPVEKAPAPAPTFGSGGGFKFGGDTAAKSDSGSAGLFSFGAAPSKPTGGLDSKESGGGGGFAFGAQTSGEKPTGAAFSFGAKTTTEKPESGGFAFGAKPSETTEPSGFSFGSKSNDSSSSKVSSGFSFGSKSETAAVEKPAAAASSFSFGVKSDGANKPIGGGFSLGSKSSSPENSSSSESSVTFGAKQSDAPSASVSKPKSSVNPAFSSSVNKDDSSSGISSEYLSHLKALNIQVLSWLKQHIESNPLVILSPVFKDYDKHLVEITEQFDQKDSSPAPENTSSTAAPVSIPSPKSDPKPLGQAAFGAPKTTSSISPFSFGASEKPVNSTAPFSFGQTVQPPPSSVFGSSSGGGFAAGGGFSFGTGGMGTSASASESKPATEKAKADEDEDQPPVVEVKQVEESDAIYDKKCKLFYKKDGNYVEKGVGMLYLKTVDGGKTQLLVRADTNLGNVLLNILLNPQIPTTRVGKNNVMLVCVPNPPVDPKADSSAPCPMLIRVKTGDDADELKAKLDELKEEN